MARFEPGASCLICGLPPDIVGIFEPLDPEAWGGIKGKTRLFFYHLCTRCRDRENISETVEKVLWHEIR